MNTPQRTGEKTKVRCTAISSLAPVNIVVTNNMNQLYQALTVSYVLASDFK